jgi:ubiquinone/menaquinone biosynthesis C-methylase UbiE
MSNPAADVFDQWARDGKDSGMEDGHSDVVNQVIKTMNIHPGDQILDLGCGNGWATRILAKQAPGAQAIGIDASPEMIARAESLHSLTIRARYEQSTFESLDFPDAKFQHVFSMEALYYSPDPAQVIAEAHRLLSEGGSIDIIIDCYQERTATHGWGDALDLTLQVLPEAAWAQFLTDAGFHKVATTRVIDSRGPGDEADFTPSDTYPNYASRVSFHEAGSLWIHAVR